jgi:phenylacetate-coenzyme A ligase PaaK-like adenylate-forming protein
LQRLTQIREQWNVKIFEQASDRFEELALEAFLYQYRLNPVYRAFVEALRVDPLGVKTLEKIPFLPVSFFKTALVQSTLPAAEKETLPREAGKAAATEELVFESSGTTGSIPSIHRVTDPGLYELSFERGFARQFGPAENWCILALLPSYLERKNSSLVYMASRLIAQTKHQSSGFYLHELNKLRDTLIELEQKKTTHPAFGSQFRTA